MGPFERARVDLSARLSLIMLMLLLLPLLDGATSFAGLRSQLGIDGTGHQQLLHDQFGSKQGQYGMSGKTLKNGGLFPPVFNVATKAEISANATCGEDGPESFCKPAESTRCGVCDSRSPDPNKRHNINQALDSNPSRWWQSPTLTRGDEFEFITVTLDLKQTYQIEYVIVKAANSPRPAAWILERSTDGDNYQAWQYYAPTDEECWTRYSMPPVLGKPTYLRDDDVICTSFYSRQIPMENGEIHTQLVNGRPGAPNHTQTIQDFTQARYVRMRFQGLRRKSEVYVDKKRAFYSLREINIGGRCICSGHSSRCKFNAFRKRHECECERHTCGEMCDRCCPMFNQIPWKPGTSGKGFHCEKCNCNGHAMSCRYDPEVAEQKLSMDIRGKFRGGGVCVDCSDYTTGINCEKCAPGYYRPFGVLPNDARPCVPCDCHIQGSTGHCTSEDDSSTGKIAGTCECKTGFAGLKCDKCAPGFRHFPECSACPCDPRGVKSGHDCEANENCSCKRHVEGQRCERCSSGHFGLSRDNPEGCLSCFCSGISGECTAAKLAYSQVSTLQGWQVSDINASRAVSPSLQGENGWPTIAGFEVEYRSPYWLAPKVYAGNHLSSYGSNLSVLVSWIIMRGDTSGKPTTEPDVVLIGKNGLRIAYGDESHPGQEAKIEVPLLERDWYHVHMKPDTLHSSSQPHRKNYRGNPVTRQQMLSVLSDLKYVLIRAQYHTEQFEGSIKSLVLPVGEASMEYGKESLVEACSCPLGYSGLSCESCSWGYVKVQLNSSDHHIRHKCIRCDCNNHSASCDISMGECNICEHNTAGPKCDRCMNGYYGDATRGTPEDCIKCACPLDIPSNNFSPSCQMDSPDYSRNGYVCTQCPAGYTGDHCEMCDVGYYGNPLVPGSMCEPCLCSGAPCDQETGRCLECRGNTEGWKCEKCKEGHYGDPKEFNCLPCNCNTLGSISPECDSHNGQCQCRPLFDGRDCSRCVEGYGNVTAGCVECDCGVGASDDGQCDPVSGRCNCSPGVVGLRCDRCDTDRYGLSFDGCADCACHPLGSLKSSCDPVSGQCQCKFNVVGQHCDKCFPNHWGLNTGLDCLPCGCNVVGSYNSSCDDLTGQCYCKPGVGGLHCDTCLLDHYGFSEYGCQACEPCARPNHVCDPQSGRCSCPPLSFGERCDRCRPGSYDLRPGLGCQACKCDPVGSQRQQCSSRDGQCLCREGFSGRACDKCAPGHYDYPRCKPCDCDQAGSFAAECDRGGQCPCKANVIGRRCDQCREGTFGLSVDNSLGCSECFCFGKTRNCKQARLSWGQRKLPRPRILYINDTVDEIVVVNYESSHVVTNYDYGLNKSNHLYVIPGDGGDVTLPMNFYQEYPVYWQLPESFLGDKVASYGGFIRFTTITEGGYVLRLAHRFPLIQIQGNGIILEYAPPNSNNDSCYVVRLHESVWIIRNRPEVKVTREILMTVLQNVQHIFVRASEFIGFSKATLLDASMDAAVFESMHVLPLANGVEQCLCPPEYTGSSCQNPNQGYYRWIDRNSTEEDFVELVGFAKPCECNGRSDTCDRETGHCLNCRKNTKGPACEICAESFYGDPDTIGCLECPCPHMDKKFSSTCEVSNNNEVVCICKSGYTGPRCEYCAVGYYGQPSVPGGSCEPCECNMAGSSSDRCDMETGRCHCKPGFTGRDCSRCIQERHVLIGNRCSTCNDNCTGLLLNDLEILKYDLINATTHISTGYLAPPWEQLAAIDDNITFLFERIEWRNEIERTLDRIPRENYDLLLKRANALFNDSMELLQYARVIKSQGGDTGNNAYSLKMEVEGLRREIEGTVKDLFYYGNDTEKIEIEKALDESNALLNEMKRTDLTTQQEMSQALITECTEYSGWLDAFWSLMEPVDEYKSGVDNYSVKLTDTIETVEKTMEILESYQSTYNEVNATQTELSHRQKEVNDLNAELSEAVDQGQTFVRDANNCIVSAEKNLLAIPELTDDLQQSVQEISKKEENLYRLNYDYRNKYVLPAMSHAQNLSDYSEQYLELFSETKAQAANPLKASQAYKNIANGLIEAKKAAEDANNIIDETHKKVYPNDENAESLLDEALTVAIRSSEQLDRTQSHGQPVFEAGTQLRNQKQFVASLKDSLNNTGSRDNLINVKLRELLSISREMQNSVMDTLNVHAETMDLISKTRQFTTNYQQGIVDTLNPQLQELKREGDSRISLASEKLAEAQNNIKKADAKLTSFAVASVKRQEEFNKWNGTLEAKLQLLKDKIAEARNTADGIRVSLRSAESKRCMRSYRLADLQPSLTTTLMMTLAIPADQTQGLLFFLGSSMDDDFIALELFERKVRFVWNVGGGTGVVTHPETLDAGNPTDETTWYRIEAERIRHVGKLTVSKQLSKSGQLLPVVNKTSSEFGRFDVSVVDQIWLGGLPDLRIRPSGLLTPNGLPACVHQVTLDGRQIGLWNFVDDAPDEACQPCVEGAEIISNDVAYSFNGEGYAVRNRVTSGPYDKNVFGVSIHFKTFDENALIFLAIDPENPKGYVMIFLREGRVVLHIVYGNGITLEMSSSLRYNTGTWVTVDAFRQYQAQKRIEKCSFSVNGEVDKKIGAPTPQPSKDDIPDLFNAQYFIGGISPRFREKKLPLPTQMSFLGCMSNIIIQEGYDPMAEQYYGVEPGCRNKFRNIVGFYGDGYLEFPGFEFRKKTSSVGFSFRTLQPNALLMLSTLQKTEDEDPENWEDNVDPEDLNYSIAIIEGHIQVRLKTGKDEIVLQSNKTFNDGRYHMVFLSKNRKDVELRVDDAFQTSKKLSSSTAIRASESGGLYFGGLPYSVKSKNIAATNVSLRGAIKEVIFDEDVVLRLDSPVNLERAYIGRHGPHMVDDSFVYSSASQSAGLSTQPDGCQKIPYYSLEPGALKFGDKPQSHTQLYLNFENFWAQKKIIEFDLRSYYPNGLLFITPGIRMKNYLAVLVRNGQLLLILKSKQEKEIVFKTPFNDGNWHHVAIKHESRKLTMIVDAQTPMTIKVPKKIGLTNVMYIGGLPESGTPLPEKVVAKLETFKGCIRALKINGNVYDMVGSTSRPYNVGQCFPNVESGAHFQDEAYVIYKKNFELTAILELQLEFRTSELTGVLLFISGSHEGSPSLSLELNNGKVIMSSDFGNKQALYVEQEFADSYTVCNNRWHRIQAIYNDGELALKVDDMDQTYGLPMDVNGPSIDSTTKSTLYIGGIPAAVPKGTLINRDNFNGCIRNVMIGGERRDWTDMAELHNIHLSSCPVT